MTQPACYDPLDYVARSLESLLKRPNMWGPPMSVELQMLGLVQMYHVLRRETTVHVDGLPQRWVQFVGRTVGPGPETLANKMNLIDESTPEFVLVMQAFLEEECVSVNPPSASSPSASPPSASMWEAVDRESTTYRLPISGGALYRYKPRDPTLPEGIIFVPERS